MPGVLVVVSCTKRKTRPAHPRLRVRELPGSWPVDRRAAEWLRRVGGQGGGLAATDLYAGDHWRAALSLAAVGADLLVCSAGYGLIGPGSRVTPYEATFSPGGEDSVACRAGLPTWWASLGAWAGPDRGSPRSLAETARVHPDSFILVALPEAYLAAVEDDLHAAASVAGDRLGVICAGARGDRALGDHLLPCDARLTGLVGGPLASLNVRAARALLRSLGRARPTLARCRAVLSAWMAEQPVGPRTARTAASDPEVAAYIRSALAEDARARPTPLLNRLRRQGRACEHGRFVRLFRQTRGAQP